MEQETVEFVIFPEPWAQLVTTVKDSNSLVTEYWWLSAPYGEDNAQYIEVRWLETGATIVRDVWSDTTVEWHKYEISGPEAIENLGYHVREGYLPVEVMEAEGL